MFDGAARRGGVAAVDDQTVCSAYAAQMEATLRVGRTHGNHCRDAKQGKRRQTQNRRLSHIALLRVG